MTLATYKSHRPRGLASWKPQTKSRALLHDVEEVLHEYVDLLPLTLRQIFYRLVGTRDYPKNEAFYDRLLDKLARARRAGLVSFDAIRDDGVTIKQAPGFYGMTGFWSAVTNTAKKYRTDRLQGQAVVLELWCEAGGMVPQLVRVAHEFGVTVYSSGGFDSLTAKYDAAKRYKNRERPTVVLHVGDYDPSGESIFDSADEDIVALTHDLGAPGRVTFKRLAVTLEQIERYALPGAPAKKNDKRGDDWIVDAVQAEALDPATLAAEVRAAIGAHLDLEKLQDVLDQEQEDRSELIAHVEELGL